MFHQIVMDPDRKKLLDQVLLEVTDDEIEYILVMVTPIRMNDVAIRLNGKINAMSRMRFSDPTLN